MADNYPEFVASPPAASWYFSPQPAPTLWARLQKNTEIDGLIKAYKSGPKKEDHLGKMSRTDTFTGSGEC